MSQDSATSVLPLPAPVGQALPTDPAFGSQPSAPAAGRPLATRVDPRRARVRKLRRWLLVAVAVAAAATALRLTVLAPKPVPVDVARVAPGIVEQTVTNTRAGTVKARRRARLSPQTAGRVAQLPHREGDRVEAGALLLALESSLQRARVELAAEDVRAAAARSEEACLAAELAVTEHRRYVTLQARGIASAQLLDGLASDRDRTGAACRASQATLDQARAQQRLARAELDLTEVRAPFPGVVAEVSTELGEWITPSPPAVPLPPVLDLIDPTSFYVSAPIDEMDAERVAVGQEVRLSADSRQGETYPGRLARVAPYVQDLVEQNRTVEIEAEFDDPAVAASLLPGTSADVEVILERRQGVLSIPTGAVAQGGQVLVVVEGRLEERTIATGMRNWRTTEVVSGLAEGELVVTSRDSPAIKAGAQVRIREAS